MTYPDRVYAGRPQSTVERLRASYAAPPVPPFLTPKEVGGLLQVSKMTVTRLIHRGELPGTTRVGKQFRIPEKAVRDYLTAHATGRGGR